MSAVAPGFIQIAMTNAMSDEIRNQTVSTIPVRRIGKPDDIANTYLFPASDEASFVNGLVVAVNGGQAL